MTNRPKYYFPQLDSIRGLSFLAVFFFHAFHPQFGSSFFGRMLQYLYNDLFLSIDVFFILSAFLLSWLGINEYRANGDFSFINYFIRRALRIWPLYFLLMICSFILLPYAASVWNVPVTLPPAYYYVFFISNFYLEGHVYFLRFLWTLSVEEQFYLLWGLCLLLLQKRIIACMVVFVTISVAYTIYAIMHGIHHDYNTLTYLFDFAIGILAAFLLHRENKLATYFKEPGTLRSLLFLLSLPVFLALIFCMTEYLPGAYAPWLDLLARYGFIIYIGLFIMDQMQNTKPLLKLATQRFLVYTGKISYGLYCFHGIVLTFGLLALKKMELSMPGILQALLLLLVNYLVSAASYRFIEKPFLVLKDKLRRV